MATNLSDLIGVFLLLAYQHVIVQSKSLTTGDVQSLKSFQNLEGLQKGQTVKGLHGVKSYLKAFGYLNYDDSSNNNVSITNNDEEFDELLESALKLFQKNYHMNVTGKLDSDTIKLMTTPRCGVPDHIINQTPPQNSSNKEHSKNSYDFPMVSHYAFFPGKPKWPPSKTHLTYNFASSVRVFELQQFASAASQAFAAWSKVSRFTFQEVREGTRADIVLGFHRGNHGDNVPFDGRFKILAHSYPPTDGRVHFDADEIWSITPPTSNAKVDLVRVAIHEIGHALGLAHSPNVVSIMFAYTPYGRVSRTLTKDDIDGIHALYS